VIIVQIFLLGRGREFSAYTEMVLVGTLAMLMD
jgi:hypothetical protein